MILLLLKHLPRVLAWMAKHLGVALYRNMNPQTLVLTPLVLVLLLLPTLFTAKRHTPHPSKAASQSVSYTRTGYQSANSWSLDR